VPSYAIIVREYFPAAEAGQRVGAVIMATMFGMALGGWMSGKIFDLTGLPCCLRQRHRLEPAERSPLRRCCSRVRGMQKRTAECARGVGSVAAFSYAARSGFFCPLPPCSSFFLKAVVLIPVTLLPILNPLGIAPVFANLLGNVSRSTEQRIARQVAINCWFMLVAAIFIGSHVLTFFGISLPIVRGWACWWRSRAGNCSTTTARTAPSPPKSPRPMTKTCPTKRSRRAASIP
jgi:hypothetical protein